MPEPLALFPLTRALVPGVSLKLQLFEQRYLKMIRECMGSGMGFGVVGIRSGGETLLPIEEDSEFEIQPKCEFYQYGCSALIEDWDQLDNGLLGISVRGERRFVAQNPFQKADGLWCADVQWLEDYRSPEIAPDYQGIKELCKSLAAHSGQEANLDEDAAKLGWTIANMLPIDNQVFAQLLAENDPLERLEIIATQIDHLSMS